MKLIIQAGGKGTRLLQLTYNKPKCLVSINNLPIIYHIFELFSNKVEEFLIIGDYKYDVLEKYLKTFGDKYKYKLLKAKEDGTSSGIRDCLNYIKDNEPFILSWCDLILPKDFKLPNDLTKNYIGISKEYECRWSYINNKCIKEPSKENGIAGFFIFKNKQELNDIQDGRSFVGNYLNNKNIKFERLELFNSKEIGTMIAYNQNITKNVCRPFNSLEFTTDNKIIKRGISQQGLQIAENESNWYKFIKEKTNFKSIPNIYEYKPIKMDKINGNNIFYYKDVWDINKKKEILSQIVDMLDNLHKQDNGIKSNIDDLKENYITKTFDRLNKVKDLIPFADKKDIIINDKKYINIFFLQEKLEQLIKDNFYNLKTFKIIHGDCTFSNILFDENKQKPILIDPRGYFGKTKIYGDEFYDWAKLYYSFVGNYDQFNQNNFTLNINHNDIEFNIDSNEFEEIEDYFFDLLELIYKDIIDKEQIKLKIKLLHSIIWLSLTTYAWNNYDSVCGSFYNGIIKFNEILK